MDLKPRRLIKKIFLNFLLLVITSALLISCEDNPNNLGITFITSDTTSTRYLDSQVDSMQITYNNYKKFINTSTATSIMVGNYNGYTSKALMEFSSIGPEFDSAKIVSAVLTMRYNDYFFKDEKGLTSFNIFRVNNDLNFSTITFDSVNSSNIGTVSMGNFSGTPVDTSKISVALNNQFVKDWLEYAADSTYPVKNFGFMIAPDMSSSTIKGFYSFNNSTDFIPKIDIIIIKNGEFDTLNLVTSTYVTLSDAPTSVIPADRFMLQNGIAFRNILRFDLTKLPPNVIINNATIEFTLDNAGSYITSTTDKSIYLGMVLDSIAKRDSLATRVFPLDSIRYSASSTSINSLVQRWNSGVLPNFGISMQNFSEIENLDNFVFYTPTAADITKRPRLKITYTLRN
ncbi:MAG: hypothetical protein ABI462_13230 [Ignavibacteria bacterium]